MGLMIHGQVPTVATMTVVAHMTQKRVCGTGISHRRNTLR